MGDPILDQDDPPPSPLPPSPIPIPTPTPAPLPFMNEELLRRLKDELLFEGLDPILLIDLLLCFVMGGEKHLVVRTLKRDEEVVKKIVGAMTMNVFGKHTQRVDLTPSHEPQDLLRDMFIYPAGQQQRRKRANTTSSFNPSLASSTSNVPPPLPSSFNPFIASHHQPPHHQHRLSASNETSSSSNQRQSSFFLDDQTTDTSPTTPFHPPPHPSRYRQAPRASRAAAPSSIFPALRPGSHLYAPSTSSESPFDDNHPPHPAQKKRLPPTYLPQVLILTGVEQAAHSVQLKIGEVLRTKRVVVSPREGESEDDEDDEESGGGKTPVGSWNLPRGFVMIWVKVVDQAGHGSEEARQPEAGSWLYDLFTLTYDVPWLHPDIEDMLPPPQVVARISSDEIDHLHTLYLRTYLSSTLKTYLSSLLSSLLHHPHLKAHITPRTRVDLRDLVAAIRVVLSPLDPDDRDQGGWFATPDDVRRVWTAGMKHRVGLRERGRGEVMGGFNHWRTRVGGKAGNGDGEEEEEEEKLGGKGERLRVEGALVELLRVV